MDFRGQHQGARLLGQACLFERIRYFQRGILTDQETDRETNMVTYKVARRQLKTTVENIDRLCYQVIMLFTAGNLKISYGSQSELQQLIRCHSCAAVHVVNSSATSNTA